MVHHQDSRDEVSPHHDNAHPGLDTSDLAVLHSRTQAVLAPNDSGEVRTHRKTIAAPNVADSSLTRGPVNPNPGLMANFFPEQIVERRGSGAIEMPHRDRPEPRPHTIKDDLHDPRKYDRSYSDDYALNRFALDAILSDKRILANAEIHNHFQFRRGGIVADDAPAPHPGQRLEDPSYVAPTARDMELFKTFKEKVTASLRSSMPEFSPENPSPFSEVHCRFFPPRVKLAGADNDERMIYTVAELRNSNGDPLVYSNDADLFGRWHTISRRVGPVAIELYNSARLIAQLDTDPSESWRSGTMEFSNFETPAISNTVSDEFLFSYRILYSPEALKAELVRLDDPAMVDRWLSPGIEGSYVFYQMLRAGAREVGVPIDQIGNAEFDTPVTVKRVSGAIAPESGTLYEITFNNYDNATAKISVGLKSFFKPNEQELLDKPGKTPRASITALRETRGIVQFNVL